MSTDHELCLARVTSTDRGLLLERQHEIHRLLARVRDPALEIKRHTKSSDALSFDDGQPEVLEHNGLGEREGKCARHNNNKYGQP